MADKAEVHGCVIRTDLYYAVSDHTWARVNDDNTVTVGMTDVAQSMAGPVLHAKIKRVGTVRKKGRPIATVESSKWVGPVKMPISGTIVEINDSAMTDAQMLNRSPYHKGWLVKVEPSNLEEDLKGMVTGEDAVNAYRERIENEKMADCVHIEGYEE